MSYVRIDAREVLRAQQAHRARLRAARVWLIAASLQRLSAAPVHADRTKQETPDGDTSGASTAHSLVQQGSEGRCAQHDRDR